MCFLVLLGLAMFAGADDWPRYMGPNMEGISREDGLADRWPEGGPKLLWRYALGQGFSAVSVSDRRAITMGQKGGEQYVIALNADTGETLWKVQTNKDYGGGGYPGPRSTPTIDGDKVYVFDSFGKLMCLNVEDGSKVWSFNALEKFKAENMQWGVSSSALIDEDRLYIHLGSSNGASVICLNKLTGATIWTSQNKSGGYSSPLIRTINSKRQLVSYLSRGPVGLDLDTGERLWHAPWKTPHDVHAATPIVLENYVFITSGYNMGCQVIKVEAGGAEVVQKSRSMRSQMSSPRLYDDNIYGFDDNAFACVVPGTLEQKWRERYGKGAFTIADGKAYILGQQGSLTLAKLSPEKLTVLSTVEDTPLKARRNWTMPVIANGKMYCRNENILVCYDVSE
ncbi:MAG: PQQ-binding-like beta-propeller repeat protein [Candidatus Sumerlaeota bacterium]